MKQPDEIRQALIDGTVRVVARNGLDKATTKALATEAGVNEVNIYRMFNGKDDLLKKTFSALDNELVSEILSRLPIMDVTAMPIEDRCRALFFFVWKYLVGNSEKCLCFIRYYYSPYFTKYSYDEHKQRFQSVEEKMTPAFQKNSDVWMLLNHILNIMLDFAIKVFNGDVPDSDGTAEHVFLLVFSSVKPYIAPQHLKNEEG